MAEHKNPAKSFFLVKESKEPDFGFTTGTCAAASSALAAHFLLTGKGLPYVILTTPKGIKVCIESENQAAGKDYAMSSVRKFSGTDPDVTNGIEVISVVRRVKKGSSLCESKAEENPVIVIKGGKGVGKVTLPGLDQKEGEAAINSVPRKMIKEAVISEWEKTGPAEKKAFYPEEYYFEVEISVPEGLELAKQTFNPKLGITGGISILGTSGIVEPMSEKALLDTIQLEINVRKAQGFPVLPVVPGNYGADFLQSEFGFSVETAVHCSNFVYDTVQMAVKSGFKKMLFCGHIGKLVKVAGGIKNTHSKYGDHRMEILEEITKKFLVAESFPSIKKQLEECISTEQAVKVLDSLDESDRHEIRNKVMQESARLIQAQMTEWAEGKLQVEVVLFTKEKGLLARTSSLESFLKLLPK